MARRLAGSTRRVGDGGSFPFAELPTPTLVLLLFYLFALFFWGLPYSFGMLTVAQVTVLANQKSKEPFLFLRKLTEMGCTRSCT
ncbi:hypothetical protein Bca4012_063201 [Brassica carinata]|uniref:Uncharacterized protein n=1 Tax=Brassica carinata TaxID=52824 RepID=A0A8X7SE13_BRACI|nr:hypothetical protein Bca52824_032938 [Brassica carinata]